MENTPLSVSAASALVNQTLEYAFPVLLVEGEINSFKINRDKYVFFDVKDDEASLGCFMTVWQLRMPLEDGMKVQVVATPKLTAWGKFSLTVREVRPIGEGSIKRSSELLRTKLEKEGLFSEERKKSLPKLPRSIGLIASAESAGYVDFLTILGSRWGGMEITVANVQVQGVGAAEQIINAIEYFNHLDVKPELLVMVRGGGSADDLAVFNDEPLVRAVALSSLPILTGIGHEIDTSLVDLVADVRAATPSNAAERLVPDKREILRHVEVSSIRLAEILERQTVKIAEKVVLFKERGLRRLALRLQQSKHEFAYRTQLLEGLNPSAILGRGYAILRAVDGTALGPKQVGAIRIGDSLQIELKTHILSVGVKNVEQKT